MSSIEEIRGERLKKLAILRERGHNPYPSISARTHTIKEVITSFETLSKDATSVTIAGRMLISRGQGAIVFADIQDVSGRFQAVFKSDVMSEEKFTLFKEVVDGGDFIEVTGTLFTTEKGQQSILATDWLMLSKSLLPLPDKYHGLQDEEERFRKRYLDLLTKEDLRELFVRKEKFWDTARAFMKEKGFLGVETPFLELTTGGAEARPFKTHHNDFDIDVYLRICIGELWQKRLLAGGFEKTFEIGKAFRNEGTSPEHLQEFTNLEFYWAYANYNDGMELVKELYRTIAKEVYGTTAFTYKTHSFDLADEWVLIDYVEEIKKQTGVDVLCATEEELKNKLTELSVKYDGENRERLTDTLWKYCRKNISGPAFLINHPKLVAPLAKIKEGSEVVEMFQPLIAGSEVGRGYTELNDPIDQRERFDVQRKLIESGDEEAMMSDYEFVEMLEHGMPPTCGFGFGERLFTILENKPLREVQLFPLMRPK
ncbi:MAG: lysine--tRNA ligase [Candidatus Kaiserbacteria bacterium]|nr:lysine--tRNA ligase [Candidatus Kaiserbacteria bacterium]